MEHNVAVLMVIAGAVLCLGGWVIFWFGTRFVGILLGLGFGFGFGLLLGEVMRLDESGRQVAMLACSLLGAVAGFFLMRMVTMMAFALTGFLFGALLGRVGAQAWMTASGHEFRLSPEVIGIILGSGFVTAVLSVLMQKPVVIIVSSFVGATFLVAGLPIQASQEIWAFLAILAGAIIWQAVLVTRLLNDRPATPPPAA